ncbi:MAG: amidohydrolase/deacetylase family metallohydrolase [Chloroflexi bacterium]|nr:amidohydrolase/deacetylase family metallohydrolase [Chloroflexota bacterium]
MVAQYDLALVGGTVIDPAQGLHSQRDVAIKEGRIAALPDQLDPGQAARAVDVGGRLVLPGLIDLHAHVFAGVGSSAEPDEHCLGRGTTTAVDGGSAGTGAFRAFKRYVIDRSRTRLLAWLHLSSVGLIDTNAGELQLMQYVNPDAAAALAAAYPGTIVGLKVRASAYVCGGPATPVLKLLRRAADAADLPVMVHIGESIETLPQILDFLRPGDVITHTLSARRHGVLDYHGKLWPRVVEARQQGIFFDAAHGRQHFGFDHARRVIEQGFLPDSLSTDITYIAAADPAFSLPGYMTKLLGLGVSLEQIVPMVTSHPAAQLNRLGEIGTLRPGACADISVLADDEAAASVRDNEGHPLTVRRVLRPILTVRGGAIVEQGGASAVP